MNQLALLALNSWALSLVVSPAYGQYLGQFDLLDSFNAFWYDLFGTVEAGDLTALVAVVTDDNFEEVMSDSKDRTWILQFYAPWCKHCQQYASMYLEAAERIPGLRFAKMDATANTVTAEAYDVTGYPTLKMIRDGYVRNYRGGRNVDSFAHFAHTMSLPPVTRISSASQLKRFVKNNLVSFLLVKPDSGSSGRAEKAFTRVAYRLQGMVLFASTTRKFVEQIGMQYAGSDDPTIPLVLKLDQGELPRVYDMGLAVSIGDDDDEEWMEPQDLQRAVVEPLTKWVADRRFTLVSDLDSRNFFDFMQARKLLACVVIDPTAEHSGISSAAANGYDGGERKRWRDALLQVVRPPEFRKSMDSPGLTPAELDEYFFGIMDGTQLDVAEYLEEVGIPRWGEDRLPAVVVMDFRVIHDLGYFEPRDRFYNEGINIPEPAALASFLSGVISGSVRPRHKGMYGFPDRQWRSAAKLLPFIKVANSLPQHCFIAPIGMLAFGYVLKCICCDEIDYDSDEELEHQKKILELTIKNRKSGPHRSRKKSGNKRDRSEKPD